MKVAKMMSVFGFQQLRDGRTWMARAAFADLKIIQRVPETINFFRVYSLYRDQWTELEHIELEVLLTRELRPEGVPVSKEFLKAWDEGVEPEWFTGHVPVELRFDLSKEM